MKKTKGVLALTLFLAAVTLAGKASAEMVTVRFINDTPGEMTLLRYHDAERDHWPTLCNLISLLPFSYADKMIDTEDIDLQGPVDVCAFYYEKLVYEWSGMEIKDGAVIHLKKDGEFSYE